MNENHPVTPKVIDRYKVEHGISEISKLLVIASHLNSAETSNTQYVLDQVLAPLLEDLDECPNQFLGVSEQCKVFVPGLTYYTRSSADWDSIISAKVIEVTPLTLIAKTDKHKEPKRFKIFRSPEDGEEYFQPWGNYSMCPCLYATSTRKPS